jgi:hypothetical protein
MEMQEYFGRHPGNATVNKLAGIGYTILDTMPKGFVLDEAKARCSEFLKGNLDVEVLHALLAYCYAAGVKSGRYLGAAA